MEWHPFDDDIDDAIDLKERKKEKRKKKEKGKVIKKEESEGMDWIWNLEM